MRSSSQDAGQPVSLEFATGRAHTTFGWLQKFPRQFQLPLIGKKTASLVD